MAGSPSASTAPVPPAAPAQASGPGAPGAQAEIRVGDAERKVVVDRLSVALGEGRLDLDEFDQRSAAAYRARTQAELAVLTTDLPASAHAPTSVAAPHRGGRGLDRLRPAERTWLGVSVLLLVIWAITSIASTELIFFWPIFPIGFWGAALLAQRLSGDRR